MYLNSMAISTYFLPSWSRLVSTFLLDNLSNLSERPLNSEKETTVARYGEDGKLI
jgi:hypothetical protein